MQNCPCQLAMQSCEMFLYVRCGASNQLKKKQKKNLFNMDWSQCFYLIEATQLDQVMKYYLIIPINLIFFNKGTTPQTDNFSS